MDAHVDPLLAELLRLTAEERSAVARPRQDIWATLLETQLGSGPRSREEIDAELDAQRAEWDLPPTSR